MIREFNSLDEIQKYYNKETNTYIFKENGEYIDLIKFNFDLNIESNIKAVNIKAVNINANDIKCRSIRALNINAKDINAYEIDAYTIKAKKINADYVAYCFRY